MVSRRFLVGVLSLATLVRWVVAERTVIPGRDAAHYLWMAEHVAAGDLGAAFQTVFHPVYPLVVGAILALFPGLGPVAAGQMVAGAASALATWPLVRASEALFGAAAARLAGIFYAFGAWFARDAADALSEGLFCLLVAASVAILVCAPRRRGSLWGAGLLAGLAYGTRPEGAALALVAMPWLWLRRERGGAAHFALAFAIAAAPWPLGWASFAGGATTTPKLAFNWAVGIGGSAQPVWHYLRHALRLPGALCEALGYVAAPLAVAGLFAARPWRLRDGKTVPFALVCVQAAMIPLLRSNFRFLSGYGMLWLGFAGLAGNALRRRLASWPKPALFALLGLALAGDLVRIPQARRRDRVVLAALGGWLRGRVSSEHALVTDMPRLEFYAGQRPGPPRPIGHQEILEACKSGKTRYAVVVQPRCGVTGAELNALGFAPIALPSDLRTLAEQRHVLAYQKEAR